MALYTKLLLGNCLKQMAQLDDNSVDSIVTDPPYGLSFMGKKWDYDVPSVEIWSECLRVLKPGGHLLAFAGTRTQHRMAVNIEDAGFEIRDMIAWVYGSGFPKSLNISKQVDKLNGRTHADNKRVATYLKEQRESKGITKQQVDEYLGTVTLYSWYEGRPKGTQLPTKEHYLKLKHLLDLDDRFDDLIKRTEAKREVVGKYEADMGGLGGQRLGNKGGDITTAKLEEAKQWEGWGTALKPALEPITVARKPIKGTVADNVLKWGTGGLNIDESRVGVRESQQFTGAKKPKDISGANCYGDYDYEKSNRPLPDGRFPANLILDEEAGKILDQQSGTDRGQKGVVTGNEPSHTKKNAIYGDYSMVSGKYAEPKDNGGGASRFFYCAKASKSDRDEGCGELPLVNAGAYGEYAGDGRGRQTEHQPSHNHHPTVKPTDLMRYLVKLVTPPEGVVLDPFMGSGSTGKACVSAGFSFIGIEMEQEYIDIAKARIEREKKKGIQSDLF